VAAPIAGRSGGYRPWPAADHLIVRVPTQVKQRTGGFGNFPKQSRVVCESQAALCSPAGASHSECARSVRATRHSPRCRPGRTSMTRGLRPKDCSRKQIGFEDIKAGGGDNAQQTSQCGYTEPIQQRQNTRPVFNQTGGRCMGQSLIQLRGNRRLGRRRQTGENTRLRDYGDLVHVAHLTANCPAHADSSSCHRRGTPSSGRHARHAN